MDPDRDADGPRLLRPERLMMRLAAILLGLGLLAAAAQDGRVAPAPDVPDGERYALRETEGGTLRVDRRTGAVSLCRQKDGHWLCTPAADERKALEAEIARLQARVAELEKHAPQSEGRTRPRLPDGPGLRRAFDRLGRLMRDVVGALAAIRDRIARSG